MLFETPEGDGVESARGRIAAIFTRPRDIATLPRQPSLSIPELYDRSGVRGRGASAPPFTTSPARKGHIRRFCRLFCRVWRIVEVEGYLSN
jgi:hypothetical protein